jgi:hypothetical protein
LVVDENGRKLKKEYKSKLIKLLHQDKLFQVNTSRLLSEDRGAGLLGVSAYVYPNLMSGRFKELIEDPKEKGAVTWHPLPKIERYKEVFYSFEKTLLEAAKVAWTEDEDYTKRAEGHKKTMEKIRSKFIEYLKKSNVLKVPDIDRIYLRVPFGR